MPSRPKPSRQPGQPRRKSLRLHGSIARDLGVRIVSGRYKPGDILGNEIDASLKLNVSRSAYREAVRILNAKGLVDSRPKLGTRISPPEDWHLLDPDVLSWLFEQNPDDKLLMDLFELRKMVEPDAAALAASRRSYTHLEKMERSLRDMGHHTLMTEAGRTADRDFHSTLLRASGNAFLISLTSSVVAAITWTTVFKHREQPPPRDPMPDHLRVFEAIERQDAEAARDAMHTLIDHAFLDTKIARRVPRQRGGRGKAIRRNPSRGRFRP